MTSKGSNIKGLASTCKAQIPQFCECPSAPELTPPLRPLTPTRSSEPFDPQALTPLNWLCFARLPLPRPCWQPTTGNSLPLALFRNIGRPTITPFL